MSHHYLHFEDVHFAYPGTGGEEALRGVTFHITHGEKVALLGRNGAGKSTILLHTNGLLMPTSGTVDVGGIPVAPKTLRRLRQTVGMVFQNPDDQLFMPTVAEDVAFGPVNMGLPPEDVERRVEAALRATGCTALRDRAPYHLSGGQKRNVALATVLATEPSILVLDEPTSNLDWPSRRAFIDVVKGFSHTCLIASHDLQLVLELCPRSIVIDEGRVVADGPTARIFADPAMLDLLQPPLPTPATCP